jgi:hypothetical protein
VVFPFEKVPNSIAFETPPEEVKQILTQRFTFLGSGNQSFAFESEDQKWVLKLIKFHCLAGPDLCNLLPDSLFKELKVQHQTSKEHKLKRVFHGFEVAYAYDRENCGLKYLHASPTETLPLVTVVVDKAGRKHPLNLNDYFFALQAKAVPLGIALKGLIEQNKIKEAKQILSKLFSMYAQEFKLGIYDADHNVMHNTGIANGEPLRIDFGKLTLKPEMKNEAIAQAELDKITRERVHPWLNRYFPGVAISVP